MILIAILLILSNYVNSASAFNLFLFDLDLERCAQSHDDKLCVKMILEYTQMLYSIIHLIDPNLLQLETWRYKCNSLGIKPITGSDHVPYKKTHLNHPCILWGKESSKNYELICNLANELVKQFHIRFKKEHKCEKHLAYLSSLQLSYGSEEPTRPLLAMSDYIRDRYGRYELREGEERLIAVCRATSFESAVTAYREYFNKEKYYATYKYTTSPNWWISPKNLSV